jgi:hypothetical protein
VLNRCSSRLLIVAEWQNWDTTQEILKNSLDAIKKQANSSGPGAGSGGATVPQTVSRACFNVFVVRHLLDRNN